MSSFQGVAKQYTDLLNTAYNRARSLYDEIDEIDKQVSSLLLLYKIILNFQIEEELSGVPSDLLRSLTSEYEKEEKQLKTKPQTSKQQDAPLPKLPNFEFDDENRPVLLDEEVEKQLINEVLKQKGVTRVRSPAPGKAPFKHDPVARNQQYQEIWNRFPVPGCKRRKQLRWKIRELMLRRDVPVLKLVPNLGLKPRPEWIN